MKAYEEELEYLATRRMEAKTLRYVGHGVGVGVEVRGKGIGG